MNGYGKQINAIQILCELFFHAVVSLCFFILVFFVSLVFLVYFDVWGDLICMGSFELVRNFLNAVDSTNSPATYLYVDDSWKMSELN